MTKRNATLRPVYWDERKKCLRILDQRKLPFVEEWLEITELSQLEDAIKTLAVRGAPLLGIAAGYGVYIGMRDFEGDNSSFRKRLNEVIFRIGATRPTAVNLFAALRRAQETACNEVNTKTSDILEQLLNLGHRLISEEEERSFAIARNGADLLEPNIRVLTHCNTGALAMGGVGTALGVIHEAHRRGYIKEVFVDETRPLLQGSRLTAWELQRWNIPFRIITDAAAAYAMSLKMIDVVIVGADRVVRNGDIANKIGTYSLAVSANALQVPFIVAAPTSTFDLSILEGVGIPIESRDANEVLSLHGNQIAPQNANVFNPAFDITPAELITAIVTERGIIKNPDKYNIADHISRTHSFDDAAVL